MEKRAIIAAIISIVFFYAYYLIFPPAKPQLAKQPGKQVTAPIPATVQENEVKTVQSLPHASPQSAPAIAREVVVESDLYTAVFSTQGASIKSLVLKKYKEGNASDRTRVAIINETNPELFVLNTSCPGIALGPNAVYTSSSNRLALAGEEKGSLVFSYTSPQGHLVKKTYTFSGNGYSFDLATEIKNNEGGAVVSRLDLLFPYRVGNKDKQSRFEVSGAASFAEDKFHTETPKDLDSKPRVFEGNIAWSGFADKYFLSAVIAADSNLGQVRITKKSSGLLESIFSSPSFNIAPGQDHSVRYKLFFGPKDLHVLKAQGNNLEQALDLGWFSSIAKPLLYVLKFFYQYTHNYGIAIIIITVILKILFFPLTHKSYKSMKEMQNLQPKMQELREKHKNDRDALNRATMELYKTNKVNPLGGCLPMLVQIPVFFALYKALMFSIELRHAPFMLWITDLSAKDPYYVTPIIMGATMFIQQKMTPSTMDPMQAKIMLALPIVFTFMFLNFPSGLVLYWLVNNILTIAQQAYINKTVK